MTPPCLSFIPPLEVVTLLGPVLQWLPVQFQAPDLACLSPAHPHAPSHHSHLLTLPHTWLVLVPLPSIWKTRLGPVGPAPHPQVSSQQNHSSMTTGTPV